MKIKSFLTKISYLMSLLFLFIAPTVHAWTLDEYKCKDSRSYIGYITGVSIGWYYTTGKEDHIVLVFRAENETEGRITLTDKNYTDPAGPAFFAIAQTAMLTGQKVEMWCDGSWIIAIWLGEGAGTSRPYGLP